VGFFFIQKTIDNIWIIWILGFSYISIVVKNTPKNAVFHTRARPQYLRGSLGFIWINWIFGNKSNARVCEL